MYLSFTDFRRKFSVKSNFLTYFQILSAIPKRLLEKARDSIGTNSIFTPGNSTFLLSPSFLIDLSKLTCKDYYWLFFNRKEPCATGPSKWQRDLSQFTFSWNTIFKRIKSISKQNKLKEFFLQTGSSNCHPKERITFIRNWRQQELSLLRGRRLFASLLLGLSHCGRLFPEGAMLV